MRTELKEKHLKDIKVLESEYSSNISKIEYLHERQKDVTSRIQILLSKIK